jgi:hypothetical protein
VNINQDQSTNESKHQYSFGGKHLTIWLASSSTSLRGLSGRTFTPTMDYVLLLLLRHKFD